MFLVAPLVRVGGELPIAVQAECLPQRRAQRRIHHRRRRLAALLLRQGIGPQADQ